MRKVILLMIVSFTVGAIAVLGQGQGQGQPADPARMPGVQAAADTNRTAFVMANCKDVAKAMPPARGGGGPGGAAAAPGGPGGAGGPGGGAAPGGAAAPAGAGRGPQADQEYTVTAIPGVIAAGEKWKILWHDVGNNADGIVAFDDGSLWLAQNSKSDVVRIDKDGNASVIYTDTYTGGALAANNKGQVFMAERALNRAIWTLKPQRKLFANMKDGEPLECLGPAVLNDLSADSKGGVYMTMGGVYYANPQGVVMGRFGTVGGNGIILSPDGKTLYVTGRMTGAPPAVVPEGALGPAPAPPPAGAAAGGGRGGAPGANGGLVAFDVQPDGSLTNERQFADVCGDGSAIDAQGRIYCTGVGAGIDVVDKTGKFIGRIPTPRNVISVAFGGPGKKTLFAVAIGDAVAMSIQMEAQGYKGRPK